MQIAAGLLEGIASVPFYMSMSVQKINKGMVDAQAKVTLDDTYESAYGKRVAAVPETGDTGEVFRRMKHATDYFQKVLSRYGVRDAGHYILTSIDTANSKGYTLFAVVYRPFDTITVIDKYDGKTLRTFTKEDRLYYEPFERDSRGRSLDTVIDWAGMEGAGALLHAEGSGSPPDHGRQFLWSTTSEAPTTGRTRNAGSRETSSRSSSRR